VQNLKDKEYIHGAVQKDFYNEEDRENCNCPLCDADDTVDLDTDKGLTVVRCNQCSMIYVSPRAKDAEHNYFGDADIFFEEGRLIFEGRKPHHRDPNYDYELRKIQKFKSSGKLLDVGSNMGFFLRKAKEIFEVEGVEPSPALAKIAEEQFQLKVHNAFLEDLDLQIESYDVITLIDVFEHVTNPKALLKKSSELLKQDGILVIKVPNGDYNYFKMKLAKLTGKSNSMDIWDCTEHVCHYTPKTFRQMVEKNGFKVRSTFIPLPIHSPIWANLVGHYYQYPSPFRLDWKRIMLRKAFYRIGQLEFALRGKSRFGLDLMFVVEKH